MAGDAVLPLVVEDVEASGGGRFPYGFDHDLFLYWAAVRSRAEREAILFESTAEGGAQQAQLGRCSVKGTVRKI